MFPTPKDIVLKTVIGNFLSNIDRFLMFKKVKYRIGGRELCVVVFYHQHFVWSILHVLLIRSVVHSYYFDLKVRMDIKTTNPFLKEVTKTLHRQMVHT